MYRLSDYTLVKEINNENILINTYTGAVGKIDDSLKEKLQSGCVAINEQIDFDTKKVLAENGFIVPKKLDEYGRIIYGERKAIFGESDTVFLTIATSTKCNYACKYCFEPFNESDTLYIMDSETIDVVISYIKNRLKKSIKKLIITWFGGEPLLGLSAIKRISTAILKFCNENKIEYHSEIITNGYFLSEEVAQILKEEYKISAAQITLDGPKEIYEKVKATPIGAYERVLDNIKKASKFMNIFIRLNIPEYYYSQLDSYVDKLMEFMENSNIKVYLAEVCDDWVDYCGKKEVKSSSYWKQNRLFSERMKKKHPNAFNNSKLPLAYCGMKCGMIKKQNLTIGPKGELYRCVHMIGRKQEIIGTCKEGFYYNNADCKFDFFEHPAVCRECLVFPICMTGCPNDILEGKMRVPCDIKRNNIIEDLIKMAL